jgi:hypothetical protein
MEAWTAWVQLAAMRELARRRPAVEPGDSGRAGFSDFAADELMGEFHLTLEAATAQIGYRYGRRCVGVRAGGEGGRM